MKNLGKLRAASILVAIMSLIHVSAGVALANPSVDELMQTDSVLTSGQRERLQRLAPEVYSIAEALSNGKITLNQLKDMDLSSVEKGQVADLVAPLPPKGESHIYTKDELLSQSRAMGSEETRHPTATVAGKVPHKCWPAKRDELSMYSRLGYKVVTMWSESSWCTGSFDAIYNERVLGRGIKVHAVYLKSDGIQETSSGNFGARVLIGTKAHVSWKSAPGAGVLVDWLPYMGADTCFQQTLQNNGTTKRAITVGNFCIQRV